MKPVHVWVVAVAVLLVADAPPAKPDARRALESSRPGVEAPGVLRAASRMAAVVNDLQAAQGRDESGAGRSAGDLWIEVSRLKRGGHNVRQIEWYVSDLEGSLRRGQDDASARRHILNNLNYEIEVLKRGQH